MFKKILPQIIASLFLAGFVVYAWTGPTGPPPNNNVDAPINVGDTSQYKSGAFGLGGLFHAFSDAIFDGKVGIGTTNPQGQLDVGEGIFVVSKEQQIISSVVGPNNAGQFINDVSCGSASWTNPQNAGSPDVQYATVPVNASWPDENTGISTPNPSSCLKSTSFGFSIPSNATIGGILVEVKQRTDNTYYGQSMVQESIIQLVKNGARGGQNRAGGAFYPFTETPPYVVYGSPDDLWGIPWTPADINSLNFGVAIAAQGTAWWYVFNAMIDNIRITVYYSVPTGIFSGKVGIGTASPKVELDVNGLMRAVSSASVACNATSKGGIYYSTVDNRFYGCRYDGSAYIRVRLDN
ncbi:MAG: hypothetical protein AAB451_03430 [Patescibacteria group bacterium]